MYLLICFSPENEAKMKISEKMQSITGYEAQRSHSGAVYDMLAFSKDQHEVVLNRIAQDEISDFMTKPVLFSHPDFTFVPEVRIKDNILMFKMRILYRLIVFSEWRNFC